MPKKPWTCKAKFFARVRSHRGLRSFFTFFTHIHTNICFFRLHHFINSCRRFGFSGANYIHKTISVRLSCRMKCKMHRSVTLVRSIVIFGNDTRVTFFQCDITIFAVVASNSRKSRSLNRSSSAIASFGVM